MYRNYFSCIVLTATLAGCVSGKQTAGTRANSIDQLENEINTGLNQRALRAKFEQYQKFSDYRLNTSAGTNAWSDKTAAPVPT